MKQFVEKLIIRLEEMIFSAELYNNEFDGKTVDNLICLGDVADIANQLAEEYSVSAKNAHTGGCLVIKNFRHSQKKIRHLITKHWSCIWYQMVIQIIHLEHFGMESFLWMALVVWMLSHGSHCLILTYQKNNIRGTLKTKLIKDPMGVLFCCCKI